MWGALARKSVLSAVPSGLGHLRLLPSTYVLANLNAAAKHGYIVLGEQIAVLHEAGMRTMAKRS